MHGKAARILYLNAESNIITLDWLAPYLVPRHRRKVKTNFTEKGIKWALEQKKLMHIGRVGCC